MMTVVFSSTLVLITSSKVYFLTTIALSAVRLSPEFSPWMAPWSESFSSTDPFPEWYSFRSRRGSVLSLDASESLISFVFSSESSGPLTDWLSSSDRRLLSQSDVCASFKRVSRAAYTFLYCTPFLRHALFSTSAASAFFPLATSHRRDSSSILSTDTVNYYVTERTALLTC